MLNDLCNVWHFANTLSKAKIALWIVWHIMLKYVPGQIWAERNMLLGRTKFKLCLNPWRWRRHQLSSSRRVGGKFQGLSLGGKVIFNRQQDDVGLVDASKACHTTLTHWGWTREPTHGVWFNLLNHVFFFNGSHWTTSMATGRKSKQVTHEKDVLTPRSLAPWLISHWIN